MIVKGVKEVMEATETVTATGATETGGRTAMSSITSITSSIMSSMTYEGAKKAIELVRYRHFKGNEYEVLAIARHSETQEVMVVYRALYGDQDIWVRPASMWLEEVPDQESPKTPQKTGKRVKRFLRV